MAVLGQYEYPEVGLVEAIEIGRRIARQFGGSISRKGLAAALGMSERGGRFAVIVGGLRLWGVAEGRGTLRMTRQGLRAASPVDGDEAVAVRAGLSRRIPLFNDLAARIGYDAVDSSTLCLLIEEVTGAARSEVQARRGALERTLREILPYLRAGSETPDHALPQATPAGPPTGPETGAGERPGRIRLVYDGGQVDLQESPASIAAAIALLQERRRAMGE